MKNVLVVIFILFVSIFFLTAQVSQRQQVNDFDSEINNNAAAMVKQGRQFFRFDTFGDEAFWGGTLRLHESIAKVSPKQALAVGLKVDSGALPKEVVDALKRGE